MSRYTNIFIILLFPLLFLTLTNLSNSNMSIITTNNSIISNQLYSQVNTNTILVNTSYFVLNYKNISIIETGLPENISWEIYANNFSDTFNAITPNSILIQNNKNNIQILFMPNISYGENIFIPSIKYLNISKFNSSNKILINYTDFKIIKFYEEGLPHNTTWYLSYGGVEKSSNLNVIIFKDLGVESTLIIKNITNGNILYTPNKNEENISSGYNTTINFLSVNISLSNKNTNISKNNIIETTKNMTALATQYNYSISNPGNISKIIIPIFKNFNMSKGVFIKSLLPSSKNKESLNSTIGASNIKNSISSKIQTQKFNTTYNTSINSINTSINSNISLNYSIIDNLTSLSRQQLSNFKNYIKSKNIPINQYNETFNLSYGLIKQNGKFIPAGKNISLITYNNQSIISYYNISVVKASPNMSISVDGVAFNKTNSTGKIYVPVINNQKNYNLSISLKSILGNNNYAEFSYSIKFNNGTTITRSGNYNSVNKNFFYTLPYTINATITFDTSGNNNYSSVDPTIIVIPSAITTYVPITLSNSQSEPTSVPFQYMLSVNSLEFQSYESKNLSNIEFFYYNGTIIPSWMEGSTSNTLLNNPTNSIYFYTSTNTIYWLELSNSITPSNSLTIYMGFSLTSQNLFNNVDVGEAPQLSTSYAEYDDGSTIFTYYNVNPSTTSGWTIYGTAGQKNTAPSGSHYLGTNALYANSANGDYMYLPVSGLSQNSIISFDVYTTGLGDMFFLTNSAGAGQMVRLDGRGGSDYSGLATTNSWTSWTAPSPGIDSSKNIWYKYDIVISSTTANAYIGSASNYISTLGTLTNSGFSIANNGDYIGLIGDGLGSSYITYWNGFIIRKYPPNGVMPSALFGTPQSSNTPVIQIQNNPVAYGTSDIINGVSSKSQDTLELFNDGVLIAGPSANVVTYTICGTNPSINSCIPTGSYTISVNDITSGSNSNTLLDVIQAHPSLNLNLQKVILNNESFVPINYSISTVGNQIQSTLYINGVSVSSSYSNSTYDFHPTGNGLYNITLSSSGNGNYLSDSIKQDVCIINIPSSIPSNMLYYAPLCVVNNQTVSVHGTFQQLININESMYKNYLQYNGNKANFEIFNITGAVIPSWIEENTTGNITIWVKLSYGISANSIYPLYIGFASNTLNLLSNSGINGIGEFPTATSTYAQYDNGNYVFNNYFNGGSLNGWTVSGTAGDTISAPSGSPFGLNAFYANGANGDYLYTIANNQTENSIIEYYTYTQNLDDLFFLVNAAGAGQIARVGNGGGWYGIASSGAWTSWSAPPDTGLWSNEWLLIGIIINNGNAQMSLSTTPGIYGTELGKNPSNSYGVTDNGNYLGFVGDAASGTSTQYMNGLIIRSYPPNGIMPYLIQGNAFPVSSPSTCTISLNQNSINFGPVNPSSSINTINSILDTNTGNTGAYMYVFGGNWIGPIQFGVSNTIWAATNNVPFSTASKLTSTLSNTLISIPSTGSNSIYFGLRVPGGTSSGTYQQTITFENSC